MKRIPLAALIALGVFALARADDGAYKNLVGMAQAAPDRGPEADDAPTDAAAKMGTLRDAIADVPAPRAGSGAVPASPSAAASPAAPKAGAAAPAPRLWTKLYSTLLPSWRLPAPRSSLFEAPASTAAVRATPLPAARAPLSASRAPLSALMPPPDSEAVSAGERRGLAELMSVSDAAAQ